jgi:nucleoside phosphorylase
MPLVDVAVVTALAEEFQTVREVFSKDATPCGSDVRGDIKAELFRLQAGTHEYTICLASSFGIGGVKMATFAAKVFDRWKPVAAILTGIAGLVKTDWFDLGDVAVAEQVFGYGNVAVLKGKLVFRKSGYQANSALRRAANTFRSEVYSDWQKKRRVDIAALAATVSESRPPAKRIHLPTLQGGPQVFVESGASGPFLVRDAEFRDETIGAGVDANVAWLEMEGDGFMESAHVADVKAIVIKGISDPSDENKPLLESKTNGFWRLYAAANAAAVVIETLRRSTIPPVDANRLSYDLMLSPMLPRQRGVAMAVRGAHNLGFPRLVLSKGSIVGARLSVRAVDASGKVVPPASVSAMLEMGLNTSKVLQHSIVGNEALIPINDSEQPAAVSYAAAYSEPVAQLDMVVRAPFYDDVRATWTRTSAGGGS